MGYLQCQWQQSRLLKQSASEIDGQVFVTEYAGSTEIAQDAVSLATVSINALKSATDPNDFLTLLQEAGVPDTPLVHTVIERSIPNNIDVTANTPPSCTTLANIYTPDESWMMNTCVSFVIYEEGRAFDPIVLADELQEAIFGPAQEAQDWVNSYPYITRMYAQQDPEQMLRDPFFAFNSELQDVSGEISATGIPHCVPGEPSPSGLDITVDSSALDQTIEAEGPLRVDATITCGVWRRTDLGVLFEDETPALSFTGLNFEGEETVFISRDLESGSFEDLAMQQFVADLDSRAPIPTEPPPEHGDYFFLTSRANS